ncbi:MAG TPA: divalent metal cation transporter [Bryobacteraceae bacterium]|nr:divalent metal cation transporter [Bryobacteraceae bacterium]
MRTPDTGSVQSTPPQQERSVPGPSGRGRGFVRALGLGLITGAADDDPSAIGTYASAGAKLGPSFLWTAPVTFPMMVAVVYLSSKLGLVAGEGLFAVIRKQYSRWFLFTVLAGVLIGNVIEAGADIGGIAAALNLLIPLPIGIIVVITGFVILTFQIWGSYTLLRNIFRVLALALLAYIGSAVLAHPEVGPVLRGSFIPTIHFNKDFLGMIVAVIGTSLSAYLYTWQSNEEVEEKIAAGKRRLWERRGASRRELKQSMWDIIFGMFFSNTIMYFIILATAATLFKAGKTDIDTAAQAAQSLRPLAGNAAGLLFALGVIGVGFLAVPVMTTGAAYDLCQSVGWKHGLYRKPREAKKFYIAIAIFTVIAIGLNFFGINPMKALVFAGIVQGFSTPPLMLLIMRMTNSRAIMGNRVNGPAINILGWITTITIFAATAVLVISWFV